VETTITEEEVEAVEPSVTVVAVLSSAAVEVVACLDIGAAVY
jgi:hypothetical protein